MFFGAKYNEGDILAVNRGFFRHYGVYVGGSKVIHFCSDSHGELLNPGNALVRRTSLRQFSCGDEILVDNLPESDRLPFAQILRNAESRVGSNLGGFNMIVNNSKQFARWCETGKSQTSENDSSDKFSLLKKGILSLLK